MISSSNLLSQYNAYSKVEYNQIQIQTVHVCHMAYNRISKGNGTKQLTTISLNDTNIKPITRLIMYIRTVSTQNTLCITYVTKDLHFIFEMMVYFFFFNFFFKDFFTCLQKLRNSLKFLQKLRSHN